MNWIKQNPFLAGLIGATAAGAIVLIVIGMQGSGRYEEAHNEFLASSDEVARLEGAPLYPDPTLRDSKRKAIADYRAELEQLQKAFEPYRPDSVENIAPQEFTNRLVSANTEVRSALDAAGTTAPDGFYLGFEDYAAGTLAPAPATGILNFQLGAIRELLLSLGAAGPSELRNLHRPRVPEENGSTWQPAEGQVARELPLEVTFRGTEESLRQFLSALANSKEHFYVIRSMRIANERQTPPLSGDAKFDPPQGAGAAAPADSPFGDFVFPGEEAPAEEATPEEAPEAAEAPAAGGRAIVPGDTSRILAQVLGSEQVLVFIRLDVLQFLPPAELPQP